MKLLGRIVLLCSLMWGASVFAEGDALCFAPDVRKGIDDLIAAVGKGSPDYDPENRPYVVFDFDNTTCIFDIQYQACIYQLETMSFAVGVPIFREVLRDVNADTSLSNMIEDVVDAYGKLWIKYGPFTPTGVAESVRIQMTNDVQWLEFASKMRTLVENEDELSESWPLRWFSRMTPDQVYSIVSNSCAKYSAVETHCQTLEGPPQLHTRYGPVTNSFLNGLTVTPEIKWLYKTLSENGIDVWICSASEINQVRAAVDHFGLHDYLTGAVAKTMRFGPDGTLRPRYDYETGYGYFAEANGTWRQDSLATHANCAGPGKVAAITSAIAPHYGGRSPVAGFMDSTGDFNFCTEFRDMKLVVCFNRADRSINDGGGLVAEVAIYERDILGYDLATANAASNTLYVLQGRDENGMRSFVATNATLRFDEDEYRLFKNQDNYDQLDEMINGEMSVAEAFNTFVYGFLSEYDGYHSIGDWSVSTYPWQQNVYTNRFTIMCETTGVAPGLVLQYGEGYLQTISLSYTNGLMSGTYIYKARVFVDDAAGETIPYRLAVGDVPIAGSEGLVRLWKDEDAAFSCSVWGDNQEGVQTFDWGDDRYLCVRKMFEHMVAENVDFGVTSGDLCSDCNYDDEVSPGILHATDDIFGRTRPYYVAFGNHDATPEHGSGATKRYFETGSLNDPYWGTSEDGCYYFYRNDVLFIFAHWGTYFPTDILDTEFDVDRTRKWLAKVLATERARKAKFRILLQHPPFWLECWGVMNVQWFYNDVLFEIAKAGGVDIVFSGHMHGYEHIEKDGIVQVTNGGFGYLDHGERVYTDNGSATKVGGHQDVPFLFARQASYEGGSLGSAAPVRMGCLQGYGILSVTNDTLVYKAHGFNADGSYIGVYDSFILHSKTVSSAGSIKVVRHGSVSLDPNRPVDNAAWAEYKTAIGESHVYDSLRAHDPVVNVSKREIEEFCEFLNDGHRLPTVSELKAIFGGDLRRDVSEWTSDVDRDTGWCRILGGNTNAIDGTWCRDDDAPAVASSDCHANWLGFRLVTGARPAIFTNEMDKAVAALAKISNPAEVYEWRDGALVDISDEWTNGMTRLSYDNPVLFAGEGDLRFELDRDVVFKGGLGFPNATRLDFSMDLDLMSKSVTVKNALHGGLVTNRWTGALVCDQLTLDNVAGHASALQVVTDDRKIHLMGTNDLSGTLMSISGELSVPTPSLDCYANDFVVADGVSAATLRLRRVQLTNLCDPEGESLRLGAGLSVGAGVTLVLREDLRIETSEDDTCITVDGCLKAAGVNVTAAISPRIIGSGTVETTHFGSFQDSLISIGVSNVVLLSSAPWRSYCGKDGTVENYAIIGPSVSIVSRRPWSMEGSDEFGWPYTFSGDTGACVTFAGDTSVTFKPADCDNTLEVRRDVMVGEGEELIYPTLADAEHAAGIAMVARPNADVKSVVSAPEYDSYFEIEPMISGDGWTLTASFSVATINDVQSALTDSLPELVANMTNDVPATTIETLSGLYYGIASTTNVYDFAAGEEPSPTAWTLGDGTEKVIFGENPSGASDKVFHRLHVRD